MSKILDLQGNTPQRKVEPQLKPPASIDERRDIFSLVSQLMPVDTSEGIIEFHLCLVDCLSEPEVFKLGYFPKTVPQHPRPQPIVIGIPFEVVNALKLDAGVNNPAAYKKVFEDHLVKALLMGYHQIIDNSFCPGCRKSVKSKSFICPGEKELCLYKATQDKVKSNPKNQ